MNDLLKIPIPLIRIAIETYEHITFTDEEWNTGLYGWRVKRKFRRYKTDKGWLTRKETLSLAQYLTSPYVNIEFGEKGFFLY